MEGYTQAELYELYPIMSGTRVALAGKWLLNVEIFLDACNTDCAPVATAICIWDWLATLTSEVEYVWKSNKLFTFLNMTFLVNRYVRNSPSAPIDLS
jgi:hypothetical protein